MKEHLTISIGNSKIGAVPNISLTPGKSCRPGVPCFNEGCYAMTHYRMYPATRNAWDSNLNLWNTNMDRFINDLSSELKRSNPLRFRYHVGGDIPDQSYLKMMCLTAKLYGDTKFLAFTKKYELDFDNVPDNLVIVWSAWPGLDFPEDNPHDFPTAWLSEDPRAPLGDVHIRCPGNCSDDFCSYKCWDSLVKGMAVIFDKH